MAGNETNLLLEVHDLIFRICFKVNLMVQSRNRKVPENWNNSWGYIVQWNLHNHRPSTMSSTKYSQTPFVRTLMGP